LVFSFQEGLPHEIFIYFTGAFPAFADGPDHQGLSPPHIARSEYLGDIGLIAFFGCFYIASFVQFDAQFLQILKVLACGLGQ